MCIEHNSLNSDFDLNVTQAGDFSNGISQVQSMYAPEFTTHSEGVRVGVE